MTVSLDNGKITRKEMPKLFSWDYDQCDMVKCCQNLNFGKIDSKPLTGKNEEL